MAEPDSLPPSYDDATSLPGRRPPHPRPTPELTHTINIKVPRATASGPLPIPFPSDEASWTARDIQHDDWARFVSNLAGARETKPEKKGNDEGAPTDEQVEAMREALGLWNYNFFEPRGCKVFAAGFEEVKQTPEKAKQSIFIFGKEGIGFRLPGGGMFGISTGLGDVKHIGLVALTDAGPSKKKEEGEE